MVYLYEFIEMYKHIITKNSLQIFRENQRHSSVYVDVRFTSLVVSNRFVLMTFTEPQQLSQILTHNSKEAWTFDLVRHSALIV